MWKYISAIYSKEIEFMAEKMKNMNVGEGVMASLVEMKKGHGFRSLSDVVSYLLELINPQERAVVSQRVAKQNEYNRAMAESKKLREELRKLLSEPIHVNFVPVELRADGPALRSVMAVDQYRLSQEKRETKPLVAPAPGVSYETKPLVAGEEDDRLFSTGQSPK